MHTPTRTVTCLLMGLLIAACATSPSPQATVLPDWLRQRIAAYEAGPQHESPQAIWRVQHQGHDAYFVSAACCDQMNPLWDAQGHTLCHPSGGFTGRGDGQCPVAKDAGTASVLVWSKPGAPAPAVAPLGP